MYLITNSLRAELRKPFGKLLTANKAKDELSSYKRVITVGDISTATFSDFYPIAIVDFRTMRNVRTRRIKYDFKITNPPGSITNEAIEIIRFAISSASRKVIYVDGEEDLLAIPAMIYSNDDDAVVYGMGGKFVIATQKERALDVLGRMHRGKYDRVVAAGTFDRFHSGHRYFLKMAYFYGRELMIGITSDEMAKKKDTDIESFSSRKANVERFLKSSGIKYKIFEINDAYGFCLTEDTDAIVATKDTLENVNLINERRRSLGMKELNVFVIPYLTKRGRKISSRDIRKRLKRLKNVRVKRKKK